MQNVLYYTFAKILQKKKGTVKRKRKMNCVTFSISSLAKNLQLNYTPKGLNELRLNN